ncbi:MFS transporter [Streptosporangium algeriense]|uniref:MFS transporter n=1 Tax=Streptosporangium algeriense TaxID=1682748 RepID=A0ABW3DJ18_9ACTN
MTVTRTRSDLALPAVSITVVLGTIMAMLDATIVNVAIDVLGRDLRVPLGTVQWTVTGYTLALSMTIPVTGWAIGRFGAKTTWITSLVLFGAGSVLCGAAWSVGALIAFRVLQGIGGGLLMPIAQTLLTRAAGPERLGRVMAVISIPSMLAPVLGPLLGGVLVDHLSWRWMFYVNVPVCVAALLPAVRLLPGGRRRIAAELREARERFRSVALAASAGYRPVHDEIANRLKSEPVRAPRRGWRPAPLTSRERHPL